MRILSLHINNYMLLDNFKVEFDPDYSTSVLIGENGSGKTTIIECVTEIFSTLLKSKTVSDLKKSVFPFDFEIRYLLKQEKNIKTRFYSKIYTDYIGIELRCSQNDLKINLYYADETFNSFNAIDKFLRSIGEDISFLFPNNLVLYYAGISDTIYQNFKKFQEDVIKGSLDGETNLDQPYFYFLSENFPSILIGLLSYQFGDVPDILKERFSIEGFKEILIELKKPSWAKSEPVNFWGARGDLSIFYKGCKIAHRIQNLSRIA